MTKRGRRGRGSRGGRRESSKSRALKRELKSLGSPMDDEVSLSNTGDKSTSFNRSPIYLGGSGEREEESSQPLRGPADEEGLDDAANIPHKTGHATRQRAARPSSSGLDDPKLIQLPSSPSSTGPVKIPFAPMPPSRTPSVSVRSSGQSSRSQIIPRDEYFTDDFHAPLRALIL